MLGWCGGNITVDGNAVEQVDNFVYLGSIQSYDDGSQPDIKRRIVLASSVMSSLQPIWSDRYLSLPIPTKVRVYQTLVLPVITYACETWTLSAVDTRRLEAFHMKCQRQIARIRWQATYASQRSPPSLASVLCQSQSSDAVTRSSVT